MADTVEPRARLIFAVGGTTIVLQMADYPWCVEMRVRTKGGNAADGVAPGRPGYLEIDLYDRKPEHTGGNPHLDR